MKNKKSIMSILSENRLIHILISIILGFVVGALFLAVIAVVPAIAGPHLIEHLISWIVYGSDSAKEITGYLANPGMASYGELLKQQLDTSVSSLASVFTFGGTSLLIVVGVAIETFRELEAQLTMRNFKNVF